MKPIILLLFLLSLLCLFGIKSEEGFEGYTWSEELKKDFLNYQSTHNPTFIYDINIVQKQASPEEVQYLFKNNKWFWSEQIKRLYKQTIMNSTIIAIDPDVSLSISQKTYNEQAIKEILSWKTKEGLFILNGASIGNSKNVPKSMNNIIKCGNDNSGMKKIINMGYGSINGEMIQNITDVKNEDIPNVVNGFKFINEPCNPCGPLNNTPDYSCPFSINVGDGIGVSSIWKNLWNI